MSAIQPAGTAGRREEPVIVRCPRCGGAREVSARQARRPDLVCRDCCYGHVVPVSDFYDFWREKFSAEEIQAMARAIWG